MLNLVINSFNNQNGMTTLLKDITQEEYNRLATQYETEVGKAPEATKLDFFAKVQKKIERRLRKKFFATGYRLIRMPGAGVNFKVVSRKDAFGFNVITQLIPLSEIVSKVLWLDILVNHFQPKDIRYLPDIKIIVPEYLEAKIDEVIEIIFQKFLKMKKLL